VSHRLARALRIVQVSDCHVAREPRADYRGCSADAGLLSLLPAIRRWRPDLLILTGDASEDASAASYGRVAAFLSTAGAPMLALPGNHDDAGSMRQYFAQGPWEGPSANTHGDWCLILLDSTQPGRIDGAFSAAALDRLDRELSKRPGSHTLLALHHQPVPAGSFWIDRYPLQHAEPFWGVVDQHRQVRCIVWGHVHQDYRSKRGAVVLLGCPSSVANSLPNRERFTPDSGGPACRWLELSADGGIETGLLHAV